MEATGGYKREVLYLLAAEGFALVLANPRHVRRFAEGLGYLEKTDRIDADLPEIGTLSSKAVTKLEGLEPMARDSGKSTGKRPVRGGRSSVRDILFLVASITAKYDPELKAFYERLTKAGKPKKVVLIAVARKLLVRLARGAHKNTSLRLT